MKYGELIKERRALLGLTQQDLSDYTGLSVRIIKSVELEDYTELYRCKYYALLIINNNHSIPTDRPQCRHPF